MYSGLSVCSVDLGPRLWLAWPSSSVSMWPSCIMGLSHASVYPSTQCHGRALPSPSWPIFDHGLPTHFGDGHPQVIAGRTSASSTPTTSRPQHAGLHIYTGPHSDCGKRSLITRDEVGTLCWLSTDLDIPGPQSFRITGQATGLLGIWQNGQSQQVAAGHG